MATKRGSTSPTVESTPKAPRERMRRSRGEPRRLLLEAAREVFTAKGFAGTSTREIADRAGVSETLMFRYFGSKLGLFREALVTPFADFVQSFNERWSNVSADEIDVEGLTRQFIGELFDIFRANRGLVVMLWAADAHDESELAESGVFDEVVAHLQTLVHIGSSAAQMTGHYVTPPPDLTTRATLSMVAGMAVFGESFYGPRPPKPAAIKEALVVLSLRMHMPPDA